MRCADFIEGDVVRAIRLVENVKPADDATGRSDIWQHFFSFRCNGTLLQGERIQ